MSQSSTLNQIRHALNRLDQYWDRGILVVAWAFAFFYSFFSLNDHFVHLEKLGTTNDMFVFTGTGLSWRDIYVAGVGEGSARNRFLSWSFHAWDTKFRYWLFDLVPFHPTLSLIWIFSLVLSPLLIFLLARKLSGSTDTGARTASFYLVSMGLLSCVTQYFHPAKPVTDFFILWILYLGVSLVNVATPRSWICLFIALTVGCYFDETYFAIFLYLPILCTELFLRRETRARTIGIWLVPFLIFCVVITWIFPPLMKYLEVDPDFSFWRYALTSNTELLQTPLLRFGNTAVQSFVGHFIYRPWLNSGLKDICLLGEIGVATGLAAVMFARLKREDRILFLRIFMCLATWAVFQTLILSRRNSDLFLCFYWGTTASIFFALILGALFAWRVPPIFKWLGRFGFIFIMVNAFQIYQYENQVMKTHMLDNNKFTEYAKQQVQFGRLDQPITSELVKKVWLVRRNPEQVVAALKGAPLTAVWLYYAAAWYWTPEEHLRLPR